MTMQNPDLAEKLAAFGFAEGEYTLRPHSMMRRAIARRLSEAVREAPQFSLFASIEMEAATAWRAEKGRSGQKISLNDLIVAASARALADTPEANVSYLPEGMVEHAHADVAIAVAVKAGVVAPIIRRAGQKSPSEIGAEARVLVERAKAMKLKPEDYVGGALTVSNLGMFGVSSFTSIVTPPQSAILSVGAVEERAIARDGVLLPAQLMSVTLTCDHRAIDGAIGGRWLRAFRARLGDLAWAG